MQGNVMHRAIVLSAAVAASFAATVLHLQGHKRSAPRVDATLAPAISAEISASAAPNIVFSRVATGYHNAPKAPSTSIAVEETTAAPDDPDVMERARLYDFVGGIKNVDPLSPAQQRALLEAKLRRKQIYDAAIKDSGIDREALSPAERAYAHKAVAAALRDYKDEFLQDVQPLLSEEQHVLLGSYEATEFARELQRLQITINAK
jgi:hypothetical protein